MTTFLFSLILVCCTWIFCLIPKLARAEVKRVETIPVQRCGLSCVIETIKCDTKEEADRWFVENKDYKRTSPYQLSGSNKWWIDIMLTEAEAELI
jgi:hypothetical protein